jgi:DNA-binding HxlR family transcriptional regulator
VRDLQDEHPHLRYHSQWSPLARALSATGDHWTLLIALALAQDPSRPAHLQHRLAGISSGVLDRRLQQMVALGLLSRRRYREVPPRVELQLTEAGCELLPIAGELARWGMRHMWSAPQASERVDVEALLGLLPVLLTDAERLPDGMLELAVRDVERRPASWRFAIEQGRLQAPMRDGGRPGASVVGETSAWIAALGPERDYAGLSFSGHTALATRVLRALPPAMAQKNSGETPSRLS